MARPDLIDSRPITFNHHTYRLRRLHPGDESRLQRFFYSHSPETIRLRYGYTLTMMSKERAHRLVALDEDREFALGVFSETGGEETLHAVARYCVESDHVAEVAFVVRETLRRCGIATRLLLELARAAKPHGISLFRAQVLRENHAMRQLLTRFNPVIREDAEGNGLDYLVKVRTILRRLGQGA